MGDKGYLFHSYSNVAKKIEAWIQKEISSSQYHGCTAACNENNVYNIYVKTERKTRLVRCRCPRTQTTVPREVARRVRTVRQENPDPEDPGGAGGAHGPVRDDAVDGEELMIIRVPRLPSQTHCNTDRRTRGGGTCSAQKLVSPLRSVERSSGRSRFPRGRRVAGHWH